MASTDIKELNQLSSQNDESITSIGTSKFTKKSGRAEFVYNERDRENFYKDLIAFHESRNTPITKFPKISGRYVDLHKLYAEVIKRGGWLKVNARNEWEELLPIINLNTKCVNMSVALKYIYTRYLDKYEKLNFLGEDPDRVEEQDDDISSGGGRHKKWSSKNFHSVPMKYNYNQHNVTEQIRIVNKLSTDLYRGSEYDKLVLSLMSPLPNEQDFAINVCTLMANESKHTLKVDHCPKLLDALMAHAGVYCHYTMRELFTELYTNIRRHSLQSFWCDCLYEKPQILELSYEDCFQLPEEKLSDGVFTKPSSRPSQNLQQQQKQQQQERLQDGLNATKEDFRNRNNININIKNSSSIDRLDFLSLGRGLGTHDYIGQRINQVTSIIRNLSFFEENLLTLAKNKTFLRYIVMCANIRWGHIHHMALDICGNIAAELELSDPTSDDLTRCLLSTICEGLEGQDRGVIISCLEILAKLCQKDVNEDHLHKCLDQKIYNQICLFLSLNDIMLLLYTLECVYALSSFGPRSCNALIQVRGIVDTLVSLITVEAQSYGPDGCILMRVVETVPGNMLPMVAQNIANLQNVAMSGQMNVHQMHHHHHGGHSGDTHSNIADPPKFTGNILNQAAAAAAAGVPMNTRIIHHQNTPAITTTQISSPSPKETNNNFTSPAPPTPTNTKQDNEQFALTWLAANFETTSSNENRVDQQELYKMYVTASQKAGRRGQITAINFPRLVRTVFGTSIGPSLIKIADQISGVEYNSFYYICLRLKSNPLPMQYKGVIVSPPTVTTTVTTQTATVTTNTQQQQTSQLVTTSVPLSSQPQSEGVKIVVSQQPQNQKINNSNKSTIVENAGATVGISNTTKMTTIKHTKKNQVIQQQQQHSEQSQLQITHISAQAEQQQQQKSIQIVKQQQQQHQNQAVITINRSSQQQDASLNQTSAINKLVAKNITVTQHQITSQVIATTTNTNKPLTSHANQQQKTFIIQQQQQQQSHNLQFHQHTNKNSTISVSVASPSLTISSQNGGVTFSTSSSSSSSSSSLVKSLLANKVTTTATTTEVNDVTNASAAPNNPSCLITQNVNLHQVAQRQHLQKQKELASNQKQHKQQLSSNNLPTTTISALVSSPIIQTTAVKVGQTTIKAITSNAVIPSTVLEKKSILKTTSHINDDLIETSSNIGTRSNWEPVPPLAPISVQPRSTTAAATALLNMSAAGIGGGSIIIQQSNISEDSNSTGNISVASSVISSTQINTIDDGDASLISFEGLLIPKSKSGSSSLTTEDETSSKDSYTKQSQTVIHANQMLVDLLDKKSPDPPPVNINTSMKRKLEDEFAAAISNDRKKLIPDRDDDEELMVAPSKNAANLYAEIAASILEDEDLQEETSVIESNTQQSSNTSIQVPSLPHLQVQAAIQPPTSNQRIHTSVIQKAPEPAKQVITMPVPVQRQIIVAPNSSAQMLITSNPPANQTNHQTSQATATIKTDSGLQTIPVILQKQIMTAGGQQIIQPAVIQQTHQPQIMIATNPQGQTYFVTQQQPAQTVLLAQTPQQQGTPTKTIIILQQPGGAPQPVAQQQILSSPGGSQKVIMTTQQGQQMIVTQMPRTIHQHQLIVNHSTANNISRTIATPTASVISQPSIVTQQPPQQQQPQVQIHVQSPQVSTQIQKHKVQIQTQSQPSVQNSNVIQQQQQPQQQTSIQLPHIPATIKVHSQHVPSSQIQSPISSKSQIPKPQLNNTQPQQPSVSLIPYQSQIIKKNVQQQQLQNNTVKEMFTVAANNSEGGNAVQNTQSAVGQQNHVTSANSQNTINTAVAGSTVPTATTNVQPTSSAITSTASSLISSPADSNATSSTQPAASVEKSSTLQNVQNSSVTPKQQKPSTSDVKNNTTNSNDDEEAIELDWLYVCDWRNCPRKKFKSVNEVYRHACIVHCPDNLDPLADIYCQWGPGPNLCDNVPRKRYSLMTHLLDRHCTLEGLKAAVQRRVASGIPPPLHTQPVTIIKNVSATTSSGSTTGTGTGTSAGATAGATTENKISGGGGCTDSSICSISPSTSLPSQASAAMHAIKRHTTDFINPKELMDENEGPVTKSIRLTAALILRNLVTHTTIAKRNIRCFEPHLAGVALSNVESSRTISQILYELNN